MQNILNLEVNPVCILVCRLLIVFIIVVESFPRHAMHAMEQQEQISVAPGRECRFLEICLQNRNLTEKAMYALARYTFLDLFDGQSTQHPTDLNVRYHITLPS